MDIPHDEKPDLSSDPLDLEYFPSEFREMKPRETLIKNKQRKLIASSKHLFNEFYE